MEGLFAIIFVIVGIANYVIKQQEKQNQGRSGAKNQQSRKIQYVGQQRSYKMQLPGKPEINMDNSRRDGQASMESYMPSQIVLEESEGIEAEDRRRSGSLDYIEPEQSLEGTCDEHPEHIEKKIKVKKTQEKVEVIESDEDYAFEITEDNLINSVIMAEVLGPPRSMKRSIR